MSSARLLRQRVVSSAALLALLASLPLCLGAQTQAASTPQSSTPPQSSAPSLQPTVTQQLESLAAALRATQQQVERSREQIQQMQAEIDRLRAQLAAENGGGQPAKADAATADASGAARKPAANSEAVESTAEDLDILKSTTAQQQQTKVESSSRLPVRLTGLLLFNAFTNRGSVDQIDLPSSALLPSTTSSSGSSGASLRQTILGLEGTGPVLGGAQTSARISMDFFGGVTGSASSGPAGTVRLRTAAITATWAHDTLEASYDTPIISPLSPESFATVAQPSLAWSGNLWTWAPQFAWKHSIALPHTDQALTFQLGLLDTQTLNAASNLTQRSTGAGEASGQPSYETRLAFAAGTAENRLEFGIGGLYGRQSYKGNQQVDTWASTADWLVPLGSRLHLSGELYRGRGLGSLGGGAYRDVVTDNFPNSTATYLRALDAEGGWLQWNYKLSSRLHVNASIGQDSASGNELRNSVALSSSNPIFFYARNRSIVSNLIFRPWSSIILSPEYRRLQSWPTLGHVNTANIYTLTFGYQF